jgi:translation machinery-associated protein 16
MSVDRIKFIKAEVGEKTTLNFAEIHGVIEKFLRRDDEELATLKAERRPGRPASNRDRQLEERQALEKREYAAGFWMPDLEDAVNVKLLKEWEGQWVALSTLKFVRMEKKGVRHESSYPPKGQS